MSARPLLIFALLASLLFAPQARTLAPTSASTRMPGCTMAACLSGCCAQMACCAQSAQDQGRQDQAPTPQRMHLDFTALSLRAFSVLQTLPTVERRFAIREPAQRAHTLPRLAATCIQLI